METDKSTCLWVTVGSIFMSVGKRGLIHHKKQKPREHIKLKGQLLTYGIGGLLRTEARR